MISRISDHFLNSSKLIKSEFNYVDKTGSGSGTVTKNTEITRMGYLIGSASAACKTVAFLAFSFILVIASLFSGFQIENLTATLRDSSSDLLVNLFASIIGVAGLLVPNLTQIYVLKTPINDSYKATNTQAFKDVLAHVGN